MTNDRLRELALWATQDEWVLVGPSANPDAPEPMQWQHKYEIRTPDPGGKHDWSYRIAQSPEGQSAAQHKHDFTYIAACHPQAILALLDAKAAAERSALACHNCGSPLDRCLKASVDGKIACCPECDHRHDWKERAEAADREFARAREALRKIESTVYGRIEGQEVIIARSPEHERCGQLARAALSGGA